MRILGKGKTALAIKEIYKEAKLFDDNDKDIYEISSDELTVVSPGIPPYNYLVQNTKNLISDYDLFLCDVNHKPKDIFSIWISGTNGKTTTTQMCEYLLKDKNFISGGNIGIPLAKCFLSDKSLILETSSFTLHYTKYAKPNIYILLPISDDHLSWHGNFDEYEKSKLKPLDNMTKDDFALIPKKYKTYPTKAKTFYYDCVDDFEKTFLIDSTKVKFKEPFLIDALLAMSVQNYLYDEVQYDKINRFQQDSYRLEEFKDKFGRLWVDDTKATNVDATIQALKGFKNKRIYIILGGDDKGVNLHPLFVELKKYNICVFTIGSNALKLFDMSIDYDIEVKQCDKLEIAVNNINNMMNKEKLPVNSIVGLLSPACSSLDQYIAYSQRGDKFKEFVKSLV